MKTVRRLMYREVIVAVSCPMTGRWRGDEALNDGKVEGGLRHSMTGRWRGG